MIVPTVKVKREGGRGWHLINQSDFDKDKHELYAEPAEKPKAKKPAEKPAE